MHRSVYLRLSKKGEPRCHKCGRVLKIGSKYYSSSRKRIYCEECWLSLHHDIDLEDFPYVWTWNESKQCWELIPRKGEREVSQDEYGESYR